MIGNPLWQFRVQAYPCRSGDVWWELTIYKTRRFWFRKRAFRRTDTALSMSDAKSDIHVFILGVTGVDASKYGF